MKITLVEQGRGHGTITAEKASFDQLELVKHYTTRYPYACPQTPPSYDGKVTASAISLANAKSNLPYILAAYVPYVFPSTSIYLVGAVIACRRMERCGVKRLVLIPNACQQAVLDTGAGIGMLM